MTKEQIPASERGIKDHRLSMFVSAEFLRRVDDWRFANRIGSRSKAVRLLVEYGLAAIEARQTKETENVA